MFGRRAPIYLWLGLSLLFAVIFAMAPLNEPNDDRATVGSAPALLQRGEKVMGRASKMHAAVMSEPAPAPMAFAQPDGGGFASDAGGFHGGGGGGFDATVVNEMRAVPAPPPPAGVLSGPVVLKSGSLEATVLPGAVPAAVAALGALAGSLKGFVEASNSYTDTWLLTRWRDAAAAGVPLPAAAAAALAPGGSPQTHASLTLRVPAASFDRLRGDVRDALAALGADAAAVVVSESSNAQDVTESYADTVARLGTDAAALARMDVLLGSANTVHEVLAVKREMDAIESRIAGLEASRKATEGQARQSSLFVNVHLAEPPAPPAPPTPTPRPGWSPGATLGTAVAALGRAGTVGVDVLIYAAVFSVPVGALLWAGALLWRRAGGGGRAGGLSAAEAGSE